MLPAVTGSPGMMAYNNRMLKIRFVLKCQHTFCVDFFLHRDLAYWRQTPPWMHSKVADPCISERQYASHMMLLLPSVALTCRRLQLNLMNMPI